VRVINIFITCQDRAKSRVKGCVYEEVPRYLGREGRAYEAVRTLKDPRSLPAAGI
jgi:hypothetical protein